MHLVFVYGSLKRGFYNHDVLEGAEFLDQTISQPAYEMLDLGSFPGVISSEMLAYRIAGEVYRVDNETFERLDMLEGEGVLYKRELIFVVDFDEPVWMYHYIAEKEFAMSGTASFESDNIEERLGILSWVA